jgi:hypothetical protein
VFACFSWLSMAPERWRTLLDSTLQFGHNNPSSHEVPHKTWMYLSHLIQLFHIKHGCICHIWYKCELLRFTCHKHSTSRYPEIKKRCFYTKTTLMIFNCKGLPIIGMAMLLNVYLTIYVIFFHAQLQASSVTHGWFRYVPLSPSSVGQIACKHSFSWIFKVSNKPIKITFMKVKLLVSEVNIVLSVMDAPMKMCGWSVVLHRNKESTCKSPSILSLQIFATGPTFLTFTQTHYERNDLIGWIAFEVCNAKTYELFMSTNVYKRFDPRVMEREERIGINRGLPTMSSRWYQNVIPFQIVIICSWFLFWWLQ